MRVGARLENSYPLKSFLEGGIDPVGECWVGLSGEAGEASSSRSNLVQIRFRDHVSTASSASYHNHLRFCLSLSALAQGGKKFWSSKAM